LGSEAVKNGLVDKIGGLDAAIKEAAVLGKKNIQHNYPEYNKDVNDLLAGFLSKKISSNKKLAKKIIIYYKK
jgi:protease-4